jgi:hypothetical protein
MFTLGNKLNRLYSLYLPFMDGHCELTIVFNKANSFLGFNIDQNHYIRSRNGDIHSNIYTDLDKSEFATSFLDIRNYKCRNLDIKQQFHNIMKDYRDSIHYETNETIKLSKVKTAKGSFESLLYIYIFRYTDFGNNFLYCLAERQHIDVVLDKKIVRTAAIQLSSNEVYEDMSEIVESVNRKYLKESSDVDTAFTSVFTTRKNIKRE